MPNTDLASCQLDSDDTEVENTLILLASRISKESGQEILQTSTVTGDKIA